MLPHFFFDWWFAPWGYAINAPGQLPLAADLLGQRDGYPISDRLVDMLIAGK
jgi:hypothetical protein